MNIGIFTDSYLPTKNGVATSIVHLKQGLEQRGHHVFVVTVAMPGYQDAESHIYRLPSLPFNSRIELRLGLPIPRILNRIIQQEQPDIIHTHTEFALGWGGRFLAQKMQIPLVHTAHTLYDHYRHYVLCGRFLSSRMIQRIFTRFLYPYRTLVCPSHKSATYFQSFLPDINIRVIPNGISKSLFMAQSKVLPPYLDFDARIQKSDRVILYAGRMAKEKRVIELLTALSPLLKTHPNYKAILVGDGHLLHSLKKLAHRLDIQHCTIFPGYIEREHMPAVYARAHVFVTASLSEVHPMTLIEASMSGLPIVARRDESYHNLIYNDYNGYQVKSDSAISSAVEKILQNLSLQKMFSRNNLALSNTFDINTHAQQMESLYRK